MNNVKAFIVARDLMNYYGLNEWSIKYDRAVRRFGRCSKRKECISLSRKLVELNNESQVLDTILHEIAHALALYNCGHGNEWRTIAQSIGCNGERCYNGTVVTPKRKYMGECPSGHKFLRDKRRFNSSCAKCSPSFDLRYLLNWSLNKGV